MTAATAHRLPPAASLADAAQRHREVLDLVRVDHQQLDVIGAGFDRELDRVFDRVIAPVLQDTWPAWSAGSFHGKLRAGYRRYGAVGISALIASRRRPKSVAAFSVLARGLSLSEPVLARFGARCLPLFFRSLQAAAVRRVALASSWILILDEALDDGMAGVAVADRARLLADAMDGKVHESSSSELRAVAAVSALLRQTLRDEDDEAHFRRTLAAGLMWSRGEVANLMGKADPAGLSHRGIGITASMDLIGWAVSPSAGEMEQQFLYEAAAFGQMVDDWFDIEKDHSQRRSTPATTGVWTMSTVTHSYHQSAQRLEALLDGCDEPQGAYRNVVMHVFRSQIQLLVQGLVAHP